MSVAVAIHDRKRAIAPIRASQERDVYREALFPGSFSESETERFRSR
jgi:hypothetical protein